jgi:hypothetical protein
MSYLRWYVAFEHTTKSEDLDGDSGTAALVAAPVLRGLLRALRLPPLLMLTRLAVVYPLPPSPLSHLATHPARPCMSLSSLFD